MDRIEELEREIEVKKAELRALKANKKLNFQMYNSAGLCCTADCIRKLIVEIARTKCRKNNVSSRVSEWDSERIKLGNAFIADLYPIVSKYAGLFAELNKGGKNE